jgi:hypothetical protein
MLPAELQGGTMPPDALADLSAWRMDWAWGLPLLVGTLMFHLAALHHFERLIVRHVMARSEEHPALRGFVTAGLVLVLTALLALEAAAWAAAYLAVGALPNAHDAMLYSLSALTSYGHAPLFLERPWQMMGAIEALNGMMLLGITTAYLLRVLRLV